MGPLGWQETVFIFVFALLIFGPKKLPELGKTIGKALTEFRRASSDLKATFDREMSNLERETELKEVAQTVNNELSTYTYEDSSHYDSGAYGSDSYNYETGSYDSNYDSPYEGGMASGSTPDSPTETATNSSTVSAPLPEGADTSSGPAPEGTITAGGVNGSTEAPEAEGVPSPAGESRA